ncbi:type II toxin-antitoxin system prevent-host-death family antitoxin [Pseudoxanthobacter sp. M-2]|uniref:type II toxin-antitoxin system Phd/YefM family antitoxin n=1 Tax=Pseudoxanthobacter sp. M-2 TaxID=3078754 RepID=UPI0038FCAEAB
MIIVPISQARRRLSALARLVEAGETIVVTRKGRPVFDIVQHRPRGGIDREAIETFKREHGLERLVEYISDDFDDPLPEDFLLKPLPEKS